MNFSHVRVLCIGDVMLDRFMHGQIERISPEAPIPIIHLTRTQEMLGGAGNVAHNIATLGGCAPAGRAGRDGRAGRYHAPPRQRGVWDRALFRADQSAADDL